ncbi:CoxG family protein [Gemmobacter denitrificans]|uniref:Carbon monoxide dehydrogenase subunit G n=1 Tax=Gemmobacter denitrificans TaxID=3123040 RepID=A0ABU8BQK4_9RHOB
MHLTDSRDIKAPPATVWAAILDPDMLKAAVPGCQSVTGSVADGFEAVVVQKVGPVKATFTGLVSISDIVEGESLTISGEGKGGPAGFAKGGAKVRFDPIPEGTRLTYEVEANVGGKLAQLGSRIIDGFAKKMADEFFERFQAAVEGPATPEADQAVTETTGENGEAPAEKKGWIKRLFT